MTQDLSVLSDADVLRVLEMSLDQIENVAQRVTAIAFAGIVYTKPTEEGVGPGSDHFLFQSIAKTLEPWGDFYQARDTIAELQKRMERGEAEETLDVARSDRESRPRGASGGRDT